MFLDLKVGNLIEPLTGRQWDTSTIYNAYHQRLSYYAQKGLKPKERVFLLYGNSLEFFVDLLAIWNLGACAIPVDSRLTPFEIENLAKIANPVLGIYKGNLSDGVEKILTRIGVKALPTPDSTIPLSKKSISKKQTFSDNIRLDREALILFTSGTTGNPKGVIHTHRSLRARWFALRSQLGVERFKRTLCLLPTHFGHGLICNCLYPWLSGQDLYILPPFRTDLIMQLGKILDEHQISLVMSQILVVCIRFICLTFMV